MMGCNCRMGVGMVINEMRRRGIVDVRGIVEVLVILIDREWVIKEEWMNGIWGGRVGLGCGERVMDIE